MTRGRIVHIVRGVQKFLRSGGNRPSRIPLSHHIEGNGVHLSDFSSRIVALLCQLSEERRLASGLNLPAVSLCFGGAQAGNDVPMCGRRPGAEACLKQSDPFVS